MFENVPFGRITQKIFLIDFLKWYLGIFDKVDGVFVFIFFRL